MKLSFSWGYQLKHERNRFIRDFLLDADSLYVLFLYEKKGVSESKLICFDFQTGQEKWTLTIPTCCTNVKLASNGCILCSSMSSGQVFGLAKDSGAVVWTFTVPPNESRSTSPNLGWLSDIFNDKIFISEVHGGSRNIWCLNSLDGTKVWSYEHGGHSYNFAVEAGKVYHSAGYTVFCNSFSTGQLRWKYEAEGEQGYINPVVSLGERVIVFGYGYFIVLDAKNGHYLGRCRFDAEKGKCRPVLVREDRIYIAQASKHILCLDINNGFATVWSRDVSSANNREGQYASKDGAFYIVENNLLMQIDQETGVVSAPIKLKSEQKLNDIIFLGDSAILFDTQSGYFAKYKTN